MRNFEDRMAEIRRRSGERIRARQRRNRIIGLCIPLALCLSAGAAVIAVGRDTQQIDMPEITQTVSDTQFQFTDSQLPVTETKLTVSVNGVDQVYGDQKMLSRVTRVLEVMTNKASPDESHIGRVDATGAAGNPYKAGNEPVYRIVITEADGSVRCYRLTGNELLDENNRQVYYLTQKQVSDLLRALNL